MITRATIDAILAAALATGKVFDPAATFVIPVTAGPSGDPAVPGSYTFPTGAALVGEAVTTWGAVQTLADGRSARAAPAITFVPASAAEACTITGVILGSDVTGTIVREYIPAPNPFSLPDERHPLTVIVRLALGENASFDATQWIDG